MGSTATRQTGCSIGSQWLCAITMSICVRKYGINIAWNPYKPIHHFTKIPNRFRHCNQRDHQLLSPGVCSINVPAGTTFDSDWMRGVRLWFLASFIQNITYPILDDTRLFPLSPRRLAMCTAMAATRGPVLGNMIVVFTKVGNANIG